jgi:hypothetical protein
MPWDSFGIRNEVDGSSMYRLMLDCNNTLGVGALTDKDWGDEVRWVLLEAKVTGLMQELKRRMRSLQNWPLLTETGRRISQLEHQAV